MHLTCCEIARNKPEHPSHDWHVQPFVKDRNAYPHWAERFSPVIAKATTSPRTCRRLHSQLNAFAERAQSACPRCRCQKNGATVQRAYRFSKDRLEVLRLPLKPFENYVPEFAPWPERFAAWLNFLDVEESQKDSTILLDVKCPFRCPDCYTREI